MLYGMSLVYGVTNSTLLTDIAQKAGSLSGSMNNLLIVAIFLTLGGFAFKVSAVPFHFWAPDTYEGSPTPVTAFLSVASKAGGFVAMLTIVYKGFYPSGSSWQPVLWTLAAASMTIGNLTALRQTNIIRMLAYSSIAQGGFILVPFAVAGDSGPAAKSALEAVVIYILIYAAMNLGAFAVVIAVARRTRSAEISSFAGLGQWSPVLAVILSFFLFSLAGIPPLAGWFAKFVMFRAVLDAHTSAAAIIGVIAAVNSVIALFYYAGIARQMWFREPTLDDTRPLTVPPALNAAIALCAAAVVVIGVYPQPFAKLGELAHF
jgi:NADH-quinone oxidoreductase subunit N